MHRRTLAPRPDWQAKVEAEGLIWHTAGGAPYWNESACYTFSAAEVAAIEQATADVYALFLQAGDYVIDRGLLGRFDIPEWCWPLIAESWRNEPPALNYGRFDFGFDGRSPPKLFEFNCDTPTSLLEAAVIQWSWKEEVFPELDQFTSLHDKLVAKWADIAPYLPSRRVHFSSARESTGEDAVTAAYVMDTARAAGLDVDAILVSDIGWNGSTFTDLTESPIQTLFKLYPWEWLVREPFSRHIAEAPTLWIEPIWKMIWSNKAILPLLWDLAPRHPNLLWASTERPASGDYAMKPLLAREGANVRLVQDGAVIAQTEGAYTGGVVYQGLYDLPDFDGARPVIGSWVIDGMPAGMGIREDGAITGNLARFVPHVIEP